MEPTTPATATSPVTVAVAANVRAVQARKKVSQGTIAAYLGHSQSNVSRQLAGLVPFSIEDCVRLAKAWEIPVEELIPPQLTELV
jgi:hypothetical protein